MNKLRLILRIALKSDICTASLIIVPVFVSHYMPFLLLV